MSAAHDMYKRLELQGRTPARCPVCATPPELWLFSETPDSPTSKVVMCSNNEKIGPRDGLTSEGCVLYMPPNDFYRATEREAIWYWNDFAHALTLQRVNRQHEALKTRITPPQQGTPARCQCHQWVMDYRDDGVLLPAIPVLGWRHGNDRYQSARAWDAEYKTVLQWQRTEDRARKTQWFGSEFRTDALGREWRRDFDAVIDDFGDLVEVPQ